MKSLPVEKLKPGMISAEDIMTKKGQILIKKGDALDSTLITRLAFYEIKRLTVENPNVSQEKPSADRNTEFQPAAQGAVQGIPNAQSRQKQPEEQSKYVSEALTTTTKILVSDENHDAQVTYAKMLGSLKESFNSIITGKFNNVTKDSLFAEASQIFQSHSSVALSTCSGP